MAFPTASILDNFDRANEGPPPSASWLGGSVRFGTSGNLKVSGNACIVDGSGSGAGGWGSTTGADCETYITVTTLPNNLGIIQLFGRVVEPTNATGWDGYRFQIQRNDASPGGPTSVYRIDDGTATQIGSTVVDTSGVWSNGIQTGFELNGDVLTGYLNKSGSWASMATYSGDTTYQAGGYIGLRSGSAVPVFDDFGGGTISAGGNTYTKAGSGVIG